MPKKVTKSIAGEQLTLFFDKNLETLKNVISCAEKSAKSEKQKREQKQIFFQKVSFQLTVMVNFQTAKAENRKNVKSL